MYNSRVQYAIDQFIRNEYFLPEQNEYELLEKETSGKSLLKLTVDGVNICVEDYDSKIRCGFVKEEKRYGMKTCIDHFVLKENGDVWDLYMFEMKTSIGNNKWKSIKLKIRSSYLHIQALCGFLGIKLGVINACTTYEIEQFNTASADPKTMLVQLGKRADNFKEDEWNQGKIIIHFDEEMTVPHRALQMTRQGDFGLVGELHI